MFRNLNRFVIALWVIVLPLWLNYGNAESLINYQNGLYAGEVSNLSFDRWTEARERIASLTKVDSINLNGGDYWIIFDDMPTEAEVLLYQQSWVDEITLYVFSQSQYLEESSDGPLTKVSNKVSFGLTAVSANNAGVPRQAILRIKSSFFTSPPRLVWKTMTEFDKQVFHSSLIVFGLTGGLLDPVINSV